MLFVSPPCPDEAAEMLLNEYVDGELASSRQPGLFAHLAGCAACRGQFEALLAFRLAARQEALAVPPAVDASLFARLDGIRRSSRRRAPDRRADRQPFGGALRRRITVGAALAVVAVAVALGAAYRPSPGQAVPARPAVRVTHTVLTDGALYLIDPGVTVEADRE